MQKIFNKTSVFFLILFTFFTTLFTTIILADPSSVVAEPDPTYVTYEDQILCVIPGATDDGCDAPSNKQTNDPTSILQNDTYLNPANTTIEIVRSTLHGNTEMYSLDAADGGYYRYQPNQNFSGTDTFEYRLVDSSNPENVVISNTVTVTINVIPDNDPPETHELAFPDFSQGQNEIPEDTPIILAKLAAEDPDAGDVVSYEIVDQPQHGQLTGLNSATGDFTYTPEANYSGTDTFTFKAKDLLGAESNISVANINISPVNDLPIVTLIGPSSVSVPLNTNYSEQGATADDVENGDLTSSIVISSSVNTGVSATYEVIYSATDLEGGVGTTSREVIVYDPLVDIDGDGILNTGDIDIDGDGIINFFDTDVDGDSLANEDDLDNDSDTILDTIDTSDNGPGTLLDFDADGVNNALDRDLDGDGENNNTDTDIDGDGILNTVDTDDDGDGILDAEDTSPTARNSEDFDGDTILDINDIDIDGDGILNLFDTDTDGDEILNTVDTDDDNDDIPDTIDTTTDGLINLLDFDIDGILNIFDPDLDGDGTNNNLDSDIDNDGILNSSDSDDDGDGINDVSDFVPNGPNTNDYDADGILNETDTDIDGDGILNIFDTDTDGDGELNTSDTDDDNDSILDTVDTEPNGIENSLDLDNDGIINIFDTDTDGDGILNETDTDDDNDGTIDASDTSPTGKGTNEDFDGDTILNQNDDDLDGDNLNNSTDTDIDGDGNINTNDTDDDNDTLPDESDTNPNIFSPPVSKETKTTQFGGGGGGVVTPFFQNFVSNIFNMTNNVVNIGGTPTPATSTIIQAGTVLGTSIDLNSTSTLQVCGQYMNPNIFIGPGLKNNKSEVIKLQKFLNKNLRLNIPANGKYGPLTQNAVKAFQLKYKSNILDPWGLTGPTSSVGYTTINWINYLNCPTNKFILNKSKLVPFSFGKINTPQ